MMYEFLILLLDGASLHDILEGMNNRNEKFLLNFDTVFILNFDICVEVSQSMFLSLGIS